MVKQQTLQQSRPTHVDVTEARWRPGLAEIVWPRCETVAPAGGTRDTAQPRPPGSAIALRTSVTLSDEERMRFSADDRPYKIERDKHGELTIMAPVGCIGSTHEEYVPGEFYILSKQDRMGKSFSPSANSV